MPDVDQLYKRLDTQDTALREILTAIRGDGLGNAGIVPRLNTVETDMRGPDGVVAKIQKQVDNHDRKLWLASIAATAGAPIIFFILQKFFD